MSRFLDKNEVEKIIRAALKEDIGKIDLTTAYLLPRGLGVEADVIVKDEGVVAGLPIAEAVYRILDLDVRFKPMIKDGDRVSNDKAVAYINGSAKSVLSGERLVLNIMSHLSGIATLTREFVDKVKKYEVNIMDTRKTSPNLRCLEKYAVRVGGGVNHRMGLYDQILIKDNHIKAAHIAYVKQGYPVHSMFKTLVDRAKKSAQKNTIIELEVHSLHQFEEALDAKPHVIMLDNFTPNDVRDAMRLKEKLSGKVLIEVSGGITLDNVEEYAAAGIDRISIGALTHSSLSLDMSLDVIIR